jgi:hypothetical protein
MAKIETALGPELSRTANLVEEHDPEYDNERDYSDIEDIQPEEEDEQDENEAAEQEDQVEDSGEEKEEAEEDAELEQQRSCPATLAAPGARTGPATAAAETAEDVALAGQDRPDHADSRLDVSRARQTRTDVK